MRNGYPYDRLNMVARIMAGLGILGAVATVLLRVWVFPASQHAGESGIGATLLVLLALGALVFIVRGGDRREITGKPALTLAVALLAVGAVMALHGAVEVLARLNVVTFYSVSAQPTAEASTAISVLLPWLQTIFSLVGGVTLVLTGLRLASEGATCPGIASLSLLVPVLWSWLVLANYMMTYSSMVRITSGYYTLAMYIMEMLFLFRLACYMAGVGKTGVGSVLFFSSGAVVFVLSAPLVRLCMYLQQDAEAYAAAGAAGLLDLAVGVLALTVSLTLCQGVSAPVEEAASEEEGAPEWEGPSEEDVVLDLIGEVDSEDLSAE